MDLARDLIAFVDAAPSPFHAVEELASRLDAAGFSQLDERERWSFGPGDCRYVIRDGGSISAFRIGEAPPSEAGFRLIGAHTDSPTLAVRPRPDLRRHGYRQVGVEPYGGILAHTWLDRDLTLAGRVTLRASDGAPSSVGLRLPGAPLRLPSLAVHLGREVMTEGLRLDPQRHLAPVWSHRDTSTEPGLVAVLADHLGVADEDVLGFDLVATDTQPAAFGGAGDAWVLAPRLDNLASCHAGLHALVDSAPGAATQVLIANDHEEVGSASAEGARGSFLEDTLRRITDVLEQGDGQAWPRACAGSMLVSCDTAHALHPNYADRHDPEHTPRLGGGPVLKVNACQAYATDGGTGARFAGRCADAGVALQHYVSRNDIPCGSTIGPLTATRLGVPTVDVGAPILSMHSCREQAAAEDVPLMIAALRAHLEHPG